MFRNMQVFNRQLFTEQRFQNNMFFSLDDQCVVYKHYQLINLSPGLFRKLYWCISRVSRILISKVIINFVYHGTLGIIPPIQNPYIINKIFHFHSKLHFAQPAISWNVLESFTIFQFLTNILRCVVKHDVWK